MKYLKLYLINIVSVVLLVSIFSIFYYFDIINLQIFNFFKLFSLIVSLFVCSFIVGDSYKIKGYVTGSRYSLMFIIPFFICSLIFNTISIRLIIYYLIIFCSCCLGAIFSKHIKRSN